VVTTPAEPDQVRVWAVAGGGAERGALVGTGRGVGVGVGDSGGSAVRDSDRDGDDGEDGDGDGDRDGIRVGDDDAEERGEDLSGPASPTSFPAAEMTVHTSHAPAPATTTHAATPRTMRPTTRRTVRSCAPMEPILPQPGS
jgi:hypothetical protein